MTGHAELLQEIERLPPQYFGEVVDFVAYLRQKADKLHIDEIAAYKAMAADTEREKEAREWCNAYFGPYLQ
jgi:coproporphyrinogen III oxidase